MMMRTGHGHKNIRGFSENIRGFSPLSPPLAPPLGAGVLNYIEFLQYKSILEN